MTGFGPGFDCVFRELVENHLEMTPQPSLPQAGRRPLTLGPALRRWVCSGPRKAAREPPVPEAPPPPPQPGDSQPALALPEVWILIQAPRDNAKKLLHHYSPVIDGESHLVPGLSKFQAVSWALSGGMWRVLLALHPCELRATCAGPESLHPALPCSPL